MQKEVRRSNTCKKRSKVTKLKMERRNMKANKNAKVSVMKWFGEIITELLLK